MVMGDQRLGETVTKLSTADNGWTSKKSKAKAGNITISVVTFPSARAKVLCQHLGYMQRLHSGEWAEKFQPFGVIYTHQSVVTTDVETIHVRSGQLAEHVNYVQNLPVYSKA